MMKALPDFLVFIIFSLILIILTAELALIPRMLAPKNPSGDKLSPYECGQVPSERGQDFIIGGVRLYYHYLFIFLVADAAACIAFTYVYSKPSLPAASAFSGFVLLALLSLTYFVRSMG